MRGEPHGHTRGWSGVAWGCMAPLLCVALCLLAACTPSIGDQIDRLSGTPEEREEAVQELLLAQERAVGPLLRALVDPERSPARIPLVDVLSSLMTRVEEPRIAQALCRELADDPDPAVRAHVARRLGLLQRAEAVPAILKALADPDAQVRHQALLALPALRNRLTQEQHAQLRDECRRLLGDEHPGVREEASGWVERYVSEWVQQARQAAVAARLAEADSLFGRALAYHGQSKQALYRLGRFYCDNGQESRGLQVLRQAGMLLDVPRLGARPVIDGRLDEPVWQQAARADSTFKFFWGDNYAAPPAQVPTSFYVGYDARSLFIGMRAHDDHPDSLVAKITHSDPRRDGELGNPAGLSSQIWSDDCLEIMLDADLDHASFVHLGINSRGVWEDEWSGPVSGRYDPQARWGWAADAQVAAHVDRDFWSLEVQIDFGQKELPTPRSGALWGANFVRVYRGQQYNQWVRTYGGGLQPDEFGMLLFQ
ncbi:MAG: HEAT repeat domain-containing protein [Candidatus Latescibacterota bacterium]